MSEVFKIVAEAIIKFAVETGVEHRDSKKIERESNKIDFQCAISFRKKGSIFWKKGNVYVTNGHVVVIHDNPMTGIVNKVKVVFPKSETKFEQANIRAGLFNRNGLILTYKGAQYEGILAKTDQFMSFI